MTISRILELAGLARIDETRIETEASETTGSFGFLRSLQETADKAEKKAKRFPKEVVKAAAKNQTKTPKGDKSEPHKIVKDVKEATWHQQNAIRHGRVPNFQHETQRTVVSDPPNGMTSAISFGTEEEANGYLARAKARGNDRGMYIVPPKKKDLSESKPSDPEIQEASKLEAELNTLKKKRVKTEADKARMARIETLISGLEKKVRDKNDKKKVVEGTDDWGWEDWGWEELARYHGWYDNCVRIARLFNTTPQVVWEVKNHMHNFNPEGETGHIPHNTIGLAVAEYIHQNQTRLDRVAHLQTMDNAFDAGLADSHPHRR